MQSNSNNSRGSGSDHPRWKGGVTIRGKRWEIIADHIRRRDDHSCRVCGLAYEDSDYERRFHVHHLTPLEAVPPGVDPHAAANLVTVCPKCHHQLEEKTPSEQLELLGVDTRRDLLLDDDHSETVVSFMERVLPGWQEPLTRSLSEPFLTGSVGERLTHYEQRTQAD